MLYDSEKQEKNLIGFSDFNFFSWEFDTQAILNSE